MLEKMKEIIADQLGVDAESVTEASSLRKIWALIPWISLSW